MRHFIYTFIIFSLLSCSQEIKKETEPSNRKEITTQKTSVTYKTKKINDINIFYREAGNPENHTVILLHGFPASSHQYRKILHELSDSYHLIAPDYPGFGESDFPSEDVFTYTFDNLGNIMDTFVQSFNLDNYSIMIQDYGAPIGFRIATAHPEKIKAIINQNGNAYEEGLGEAWAGVRKLWKNNNKENRNALLPVFSIEGLKWQYTHGTRNPELINPDNWILDHYRLSRPNAHKINLDLFYDYQNNLKLYPEWQKYMREHQPPMLIVWGKNDGFFPEPGAEAYKRDLKSIDYNIYDTGHFALEEDGEKIIAKMRSFLNNL